MLVTRVASPWRMRTWSALTREERGEDDEEGDRGEELPAPVHREAFHADGEGREHHRDAANCTTAAALRSACGENVRW